MDRTCLNTVVIVGFVYLYLTCDRCPVVEFVLRVRTVCCRVRADPLPRRVRQGEARREDRTARGEDTGKRYLRHSLAIALLLSGRGGGDLTTHPRR